MVSSKPLLLAECTTSCRVYCGLYSATTFCFQPPHNFPLRIRQQPLIYYPLFSSRRMERHVPYSAELLRFIKRASLQGRVHNNCRSYRVRSATVDLHVSLNTRISLSFSHLYKADTLQAFDLYLLALHRWIP